MGFLRQARTYLFSLVIHSLILVPMLFVTMAVTREPVKSAMESLFEEERTQEEFTQELNSNLEISENFGASSSPGQIAGTGTAGGTGPSGGVGSGPGIGGTQGKIDGSAQFADNDVVLGTGDVDIPGGGDFGSDLGEGKVKGEPQAPAAGYGEAMDRMTQELLRIMREDKVLVVWLFDESDSMKDDQQEIKAHFRKIYAELGIQVEKDEKLRSKAGEENLLTAVHSFGEKVVKHTAKPTSEDKEIMKAIDGIKEDPTGKENTLTAVSAAIDEYRSFATRGRRKLMIIVVSDESGDDGAKIDDTIAKAKAIKAPVYLLGRESVFGYQIARMRWRDPKYGLDHWLAINRGPETAYYEALQFDGLHDRWDAHPSGFAPYDQARLCRETGGIFFVLPHEEQNLAGQAAVDKRKFEFLDLKEYVPELIPRRQYVEIRSKSRFRQTIFEVAAALDPHSVPTLNIQEHWYPAEKEAFAKSGQEMFNRAMTNLNLLDQAAAKLEAIKPLRDKEESQRWRANYDLALAQVKAYRVRLFQFLLVMDNHVNNFPNPSDAKHNTWNLVRNGSVIVPTAQQIKITKIDLPKLKQQEQEAREQFQFVIKSHPRTPWANRAEYELAQGFGWSWASAFRDPRYGNLSDIKFPTL